MSKADAAVDSRLAGDPATHIVAPHKCFDAHNDRLGLFREYNTYLV